jgi:predicted RNA polymerase sigma factor
MSLEDEFESACMNAIDACERLSPPYRPTAWRSMIVRHGAVEAARRLVVSGDIQSGFERLVRAGRAELTIEWAVTDPYWQPLFDPQYRDAAQWRLSQAGIIR